MTRSASVGGGKQDIVGKATMTITLNWNATAARDNRVIVFSESKSIYIWAPTACKFEVLCYVFKLCIVYTLQLEVHFTAAPDLHNFVR